MRAQGEFTSRHCTGMQAKLKAMLPRSHWTRLGLVGLIFAVCSAAVHGRESSSDSTDAAVAKLTAFESPATFPAQVLENTILLATGVVGLALPLGTLLAILLARTDLPGRRAAIGLLLFLLFLPLYVQVAGWESAFGKLGWLTSFTQTPLLQGMGAVIFIHAMAGLPWVFLIATVGLRLTRRVEEEVALLDASAPRVVASVVLPQLAPYLLAASLLVAVSAASEMTVTNIYLIEPGEYTLAEQVYMTIQAVPLGEAVQQSLVSIAATAVIIIASLLAVGVLIPLGKRMSDGLRPPLIYRLGDWKVPAAVLVWLLLAALVGLPLMSMVYKAGTFVALEGNQPVRAWSVAKSLSMPWESLWSIASDLKWTLALGSAAATLDLVLAIGLAQTLRGRVWPLVVLVALAWSVPGPLAGLGIIALFSVQVPGLGFLYDRTDLPAILALAVRSAPVVFLTVWYVLDRFSRSALEAAQLDGAGPWRTLVKIVLPQRAGALAAVWLAGFAIATGDLAWSILVLRPGIDTLQRRLFGDIHSGADDRVAGACLAISMLFGLVVGGALLLVRYQRRKSVHISPAA